MAIVRLFWMYNTSSLADARLRTVLLEHYLLLHPLMPGMLQVPVSNNLVIVLHLKTIAAQNWHISNEMRRARRPQVVSRKN